MRTSLPLAMATLFLVLGATPAQANPCADTGRVVFTSELGDPDATAIFTALENISKRNYGLRKKMREGKCSLIAATNTDSWKAASKSLMGATETSPETLVLVRSLLASVPTKQRYQSLVNEAKVQKRKYDGLTEVNVPDEKSASYLKNIGLLRDFVKDISKSASHAAGLRKRLNTIVQKNGG